MKLIFSGCLLLLGFASCKKEVTELPPATQTGANTFGAIVNGEMWVPQQFGPIPSGNLLEAKFLGDNLLITAQNFSKSPVETEFDIHIIGVDGTGTYLLNTNTAHPSYSYNYGYYVKRNLSPEKEWITSSSYTGSVTLTRIDTVNRIASGTFQFTAGEIYNSAPVLTVTEGRFDVKY